MALSNPPGLISLESPPALPPFASFAVSHSTEPVPALERGEENLISNSMVPSRQDEVARGRAVAHACLRSLDLDRGPILSGAHREPLWPAGARGSISHTSGIAVALVAPSTHTDGVGVDIEQLRAAPELRDEVLLPEERAWIDQLPVPDRETTTVAVFSAKESIFKAFFSRRGEFFGFDTASLTPTALGFEARLAEGFDDDYPPGRTFDVGSSWFADVVLTWVVLPGATRHESAGLP